MNVERWLEVALLLAGIGHFCALGASFQVPRQLNWKEELQRLSPLNRKLMWSYGATIVLLIVGFGTVTLLLREEMVRGDRAALALAGLIGAFWTLRLVLDLFYYRHGDWPRGLYFAVGHVLLFALFVALAGTYWSVIVWHVM